MKNMRLHVVLKEKLRTAYFFTMSLAMFFTLSIFSQNILAENGAIPSKGMTQEQVKANFGEPLSSKNAVGKPPISRWDYQDYSVYFEGRYVIHSFYHNQRRQAQLPQSPTDKAEPVETESSATPLESQSTNEAALEAVDLPSEEAIVEEVPLEMDEAMVESEETQSEEAMLEETISEDTMSKEAMSSEETKDLNFEEAEKSTDYGKWGY